jgi:hypothetical protein
VRKTGAAIGSIAFFMLAPCVVAGVIPWWLTGWEVRNVWPVGVRVVGTALIAAGAVVLVQAFVRFVHEGLGTPAPVAPTETLVVGGLYRYVRNPIYVAASDPRSGGHMLFIRGTSLMAQAFDIRRLELAGEAVAVAEGLPGGAPAFSASTTGVLAYRTETAGGGLARAMKQLTWLSREGVALGTSAQPAAYDTLTLSPDGARVAGPEDLHLHAGWRRNRLALRALRLPHSGRRRHGQRRQRHRPDAQYVPIQCDSAKRQAECDRQPV